MATLLIDKFYNYAELTITDNELYDFLILPEAYGIATSGQIITIDGQTTAIGYNSNLESFCISVKGNNGTGKLSIGGNYNGHNVQYYTFLGSWDYRSGSWKSDFVSNPWADNTIEVDTIYNLYHVQFNNADVSGAIKFHGSNNSLVLTAQNGAQNANLYHNGADTYKTDDNICIKADAYGIYSDNVSGTYNTTGAPSAPYKDTIAYTIYATNKLTVVSDLAGHIETDVAAIHTGYTYLSGDKTVKGNDSSNNNIIGAAVKADTLILDSNFRANILVRNTKDTLDQALLDKKLKNSPFYNPDWDDPDWDGSTSDARKVYEFVEEQENSGGSGGGSGEEADGGELAHITVKGTTIAGYASPHADNNKINNYGIWTGSSLSTAENSIWGGTITVRTENVMILATTDYLASGKASERGVTSASANNNEISAYGIKSEGSISINEMGPLTSDISNDGDTPKKISASINVHLSNNTVTVKAISQEKTQASASVSAMLTAAGIDAKTLTLGKVSDEVNIKVTANNNTISVNAVGGISTISNTGLRIYGINADTINLTNFDGNIILNVNQNTIPSKEAVIGINASTLTSTTNLYGNINITSDTDDIAITSTTLKVNGVIDTDMKCSVFGIYASNITASAFTGTIDSFIGGINVTGQYKSNVSGDMFDIAGEISALGYGVISGGPLNIRVSGTISTFYDDGFSIYADVHASTNGSFTVTEVKNDDVVEIAGSANIAGNIDLGAGLNTITIDSNARIDGSIIAGAGEVNVFFNLSADTRNDGKAAITSRGYEPHDDDKSLKDSMTFTVNCNYAEAGTYNLFAYNFNATEYWNNGRQIAFSYHGHNVMLTLDSQTLTGDKVINYINRDGEEAALELSAQFVWNGNQSVISVTIAGDIEAAPELVWDYTVDTPAPLPGEEVAPAEPGNDVVEEPVNPTITESYDVEKETVTIKWDNVVAANYGLAAVAAYEIEYFLYDAQDNKLGKSIVVRLDGSKKSFDITGVANNTRLEYRIRLLGDNSANAVSAWSDYRTIGNKPLEEGEPGISTFFDEKAFEFDTDKLTSDVIDANPKANTTGVVAAIAELSWKNIGSTNPIRNYEIEYCSLTEQLTIEQVRADMEAANMDFVSLSDYIANCMEMDYSKLVTGTQVAVSNLQNQTFVYWRIRAIDSKGNKSDWVAGETFRVWATDDKTDPIFVDTESSAAIQFNFPALEVTAPDTENKETLYSATLGWNHATDSESGVRAYLITLTDDKGNKKVVEVNSESMESHSFAVWNDTGKTLDQNCKYQVVVNGLTLDAALRIDEDGNVSLAWNSKEDINGAATVQQFIDGAWVTVNTIAVGDFTIETFDFSAVITGLNKASYSYYITAIDYFGNEVDVKNSIQGSFDSDITKPMFDTGDVTFKENFGFSSPANLLESTTLKGSIIWNGATDAESGIRSYVIKLSTNGGKSFEKTFDFAVADLEQNCQTRISLAGFTANAVYTVNGESFTADANGNLVILTAGNAIGTDITITDANGAASTVAVNHNNAAICYSIDIAQLGLTNPAYTYFIYAKDYIGNESSNYLSGDLIITDKGAPSFISNKTDVSVETKIVNDGERDVVTIKPTIAWTAAQDVAGDLGVRYYAVFVRAKGTEEWGEAVYTVAHDGKVLDYSWTADNAYDMQVYDYKIVAYDFFGKSDTISGNFGMTDIEGPTGSFSKFNHNIEANYEEVIEIIETPVLDEEGNPVLEDGQPKVEITEKVIATILSDATVTLSWSDNFKDDAGVIYKVTVSADKNLSPDANTYTFWTTTAGEKYMVFSGDTTGRPVSIFEDMKTVYWTVEAYDTQYNASSDRKGDVQSFEFKNKYDKYIVLDTKLAAPTNVKVDTSDMSDGVHSGVIAVSWTDADTPMGIYKYAVNVYDAKGKTLLFTADTLDLENKLGTDIANSVSISGTTLTISDLRRFLSTVSINDGTYKLSITGFDAAGNKAESEKVEFILDTTRPSRVAVTEYFAVPDNAGDDKFCNLVVRWQAASDDYGIDHYVVQFRKKGSTTWSSAKVTGTEYTLTGIPEGSDGYEFRIYAVDTQGNEGIEWPNDEVVTVKPIFDKYNDSIKPGLATDVTKSFDANGRLVVADSVGMGDTADTFCIKTTNSMTLSLTTDDLGISIGSNKTVKLNIYEGNSSKAWKSYTISNTGRIFSELLLNSNTTYTFQVVNTKSDANVSNYEFVLDKTGLDSYNGDDTVALARENHHVFLIDGVYATAKNWVGYGDTADYQILELTASGKYTFTLSDVALSTKLTIYEVQANGKLKSVATVTANQSSFNGVTTKELLLDMNKEYVMAVTPGSNKVLGSSYEVTVNQTESYTPATTADDLRSSETPEISGNTSGWVGFGDATDYYRLEVGEDGGVYNFSVSHDLGSDEALKLTVYELTAVDAEGNAKSFRTVKSITLANTAANIATGSLYLKDDKGGTYFVEVTATGAAKALNSDYAINVDGYNIADKLALPDTGANTAANAVALNGTVDGWVGMGDANDYYSFSLAEAGVYTFTLDNINGNNIAVAISYVDAETGKTVKLANVTGTASANGLVLSREFTAEEVEAAGNNFIIQVSANGKTANSDYQIKLENNANISGFNPDADELPALSAGEVVSDWVGMGNSSDFRKITVTESGIYDLVAGDVANPVKVTVYDAAGKNMGTLSLTAGKNNGALNGMTLIAGNDYFVEVTATGAAKGQSSSYDLVLNSQSHGALSAGETKSGNVGPADKIDSYVLNITEAGFYTFALDNVNGNAVKFSVIDPVTGKAVANLTPAANSTAAAITYEFTAPGEYIVKLEGTNKSKDSDYELTLIDRKAEVDMEDDSIVENLPTLETKYSGWTGLGDVIDFAKIDLVNGTGIYDITLNVADNNAKLTVYEMVDGIPKAIKTVTATQAKAGALTGLLFDTDNEYFVSVQVADGKGTKDTTYTVTLEQTVKSDNDGDSAEAPVVIDGNTYVNAAGWVGYGDAADYYQFAVNGTDATNIAFALGDYESDITVTLYQISEEGSTKVKSFTVNAKNADILNSYLLDDGNYLLEVVSPKADKGAVTDYAVAIDSWKFEDYITADNTVAKAAKLNVNDTVSSAVWNTGTTDDDTVDFYQLVLDASGFYMFDLTGTSGALTFSIGTLDAKGSFKQLQKVSGKAGVEDMTLARELAAGTYYIKLESSTKNSASQYELSIENNSIRVNSEEKSTFSSADDSWKLVADDTAAIRYSNNEVIENWVGFGDAVDVFKIRTDENGVLVFSGSDEATIEALLDKDITLTLADVNGKSVALTFDAALGEYVSKNILLADTDYYLQIKSADSKTGDTAFAITFNCK